MQTPSQEDLAAWHLQLSRLREPFRSKMRTWVYGLVGLLIAGVLLWKLSQGMEEEDRVRLPALFLGCFTLVRCVYLWPWWKRRRDSQEHFRFVTEHDLVDRLSVEFTPAGIRYTTKRVQELFEWPLIQRIDGTRKHLFILNGEENSCIIPRCAFATEEESDRFLEIGRQYQATYGPS